MIQGADVLDATDGGQVNDVIGVLQRVDVTQIKAYERDPRRTENPERDRIKQSIRECGMDQPLVITCRPDETQYVVQAGGNTRLKILQELYAETHDERFHWAPCVVRPWSAESDVLLAHLRENDLRGSLSFFEKARAVMEVRALLEQQLGQPLSHRVLAELLRSHGYSVAHSVISQFEYTVEKLWPVMPQALAAGLGRTSVERLRAFERVTGKIWADRGLADTADFGSVFQTLCQRYDDPHWSFEVFAEAMEMEIAMAADERLHTIRMEIDRAQKSFTIGTDADSPSRLAKPQRREGRIDSGIEYADVVPLAERRGDTPADSDSLDALRQRACALATRLAQRHGLADLVLAIDAQGVGFVLRDVPSAEVMEQLDVDTREQLSMLWWQLAACAEMTVAPLATIVPLLPEHSVLRRALEQNDAALLFDSIWTPDPGQTGDRLWRQLAPPDWQDLIALMETYRRLHQVADGAGLWSRDGGE